MSWVMQIKSLGCIVREGDFVVSKGPRLMERPCFLNSLAFIQSVRDLHEKNLTCRIF